MRFLDVMRPAAAVTVQVGEPKKRLSYREKRSVAVVDKLFATLP